jgi:hypothetical protein
MASFDEWWGGTFYSKDPTSNTPKTLQIAERSWRAGRASRDAEVIRLEDRIAILEAQIESPEKDEV